MESNICDIMWNQLKSNQTTNKKKMFLFEQLVLEATSKEPKTITQQVGKVKGMTQGYPKNM